MPRPEPGFKGAHLIGASVDDTAVLDVTVPADATNEVAEGTLQETITALAARIKALEDAA